MSDMLVDGFVNIEDVQNKWVFFAISCDYKQGMA